MKLIIKKLKKYWHIFQNRWQGALIYRAELFLWAFMDAMPVISMLILWLSVYRYGDTLGDYNLTSLITYFVIGHLVSGLITVHFETMGVQEIQNGSIARYLTKPFPYLKMAIIGETSWKLLSFILITIPLSAALMLFLHQWILLPQSSNLIWIIIFMFLGYCIDILVSGIIMAAAFFMDQGRALSHFKWMISGIFSGSLLPISTYPTYLEKICRLLPFQFVFSLPVETYLNQTSNQYQFLLLGCFWIAILTVILKFSWKKALKKFTAVGN